MKAEPTYRDGFAPYVVITHLPTAQQAPLNQWLIGQTREAIAAEGDNKYNCCFYSDYSNWYKHWIKGETVPDYD